MTFIVDDRRRWSGDEARPLPLNLFDERLQRYRLAQASFERGLARSLERYGQISPVVVCQRAGTPEMIDGFKRLAAVMSSCWSIT